MTTEEYLIKRIQELEEENRELKETIDCYRIQFVFLDTEKRNIKYVVSLNDDHTISIDKGE